MPEIKLTRVPTATTCKIRYWHIYGTQQKAGVLTLTEQSMTQTKLSLGFGLQRVLPSRVWVLHQKNAVLLTSLRCRGFR